MRLHCPRLALILTTKWKLVLMGLLTAITLNRYTRQSSSFIVRRPKTLLIYNNEHLCSSNTSLAANVHIRHRSISSSPRETVPTTSLVIVIPSRRKNFLQRNLIRQTYGSIRHSNNVHILAVVFMLCILDDPNDVETDLGELFDERVGFGDVIMGDSIDIYRNLSRKSIMAFDWLTSYCREADLVLKTDDDVLVDIFKLTAELGKLPATELESLKFWCAVHPVEAIYRDPKSIYYVSRAEYAHEKFPKHCAGVGYVATRRLVRRITDEISTFWGPICSHEDVFLTGIIPEIINSNKYHSPIEFVNKMDDWIFYITKDNPNSDGKYVWNAIDRPVNQTVDFDEFRKRSGTRVFYLLQQDADFEKKFLRLWYLVETSFRNEETINEVENK